MPFNPKTVVIYSVGLLGGSLGLALRNSGFKGRIIGLSSPDKAEIAKKLGCIDDAYPYDKLADIIGSTDLLVLCPPVNVIKKTIERLASLPLPEGLVITDVGSTKQEIADLAKRVLPARVTFVGGHPMAGSEKNGPAAADPYLFQNAIFVLTPQAEAAGARDRDLAAFLEKFLGCRTLFLDAAVHDRIVAAVSHVPHLLAVALVNLAQGVDTEVPGTLALAAGGFRDMTRIAGSSYELWHDILSTNKNAIEPLLEEMIRQIGAMKRQLRENALRQAFEQAEQTRSRIPQNAKGFLHQLSEVLVVVKDEPGIIAKIASALARRDINIRDIEVLKVREGEGGTIRLAFDSPAAATEAAELLQSIGFTARERI
jgi:prephenate dehydrogenase